MKSPNRQALLWVIIIAVVPLLFMFNKPASGIKKLTHTEFMQAVEEDRIESGTITYEPDAGEHALMPIKGKYRPTSDAEPVDFEIKTRLFQETEEALLASGKFKTHTPNTLMLKVLLNLLPFLLLIGLLYYVFIRQIKMAGKGAMSFGKSRARMLNKEKNKTTFKDVAGVEEAKEEVAELVDFLKDPKKFQRLGGRIPKGILMVGSPGTGKTLLARAIAGEADASFFSISGSDFVEMFVGVGASRVRDMFEQARKATPCLIFIDEIDAVGRSRGHGLGGGNDEREQTLNALLVEMDGFDSQEGIIIIAATNRPDVLDKALLRPGRFDRQITVSLPDVRGREAILKVHAKAVKLEKDVDLGVIARGTPGYSGAELQNLLNEAALLAARQSKKAVGMKEMEEARDKVRWGRERRSMAMTDEDKKHTAWHEAGHALVNVMLEHTHPLHKVTIIPRGQALGATMYLPKEDLLNRHKKELLDIIAVMMAGRIAEEVVARDISSGASGDIQQATATAHAMVCQWGMSDELGMVLYDQDDEYVFLGRDMGKSKGYSEETAQKIDAEIRKIIDTQFHVAKTLLEDNADKLEMIANALLDHETLEGWQVEEIVSKGTFTPPPTMDDDTPPTAAATLPIEDDVPGGKEDDDLGEFGTPEPAPV